MRRVHEPPKIPRLKRDAHKGDRGRVFALGGSLRMSGAIRLTGWGALRGGAGLVTIACPDAVHAVVAAELTCALTLPLPSRKGVFTVAGAALAKEHAARADAVVVGPGMDTGPRTFLRRFLDGLEAPVVLDADALNLLALEPEMAASTAGARVLTPHPGEAARLLDADVPKDREGRVRAAARLADKFHAVVVLKGAGTIVCDGDRCYVCGAGNPGMGTGGTGDVLAGLIAARLAAGADPFPAAAQAVFVHARAGDLASAACENAMIATDLVANLPAAMSELCESAPARRKTAKASKSVNNRSRSRRRRS
ncbi:MAG: NAD(P)H-hydrate dehydratase [Planctomycetota bacterium]|nr:NAD(P)H-hydrate dehydratase [Planctomycetota bacterium]